MTFLNAIESVAYIIGRIVKQNYFKVKIGEIRKTHFSGNYQKFTIIQDTTNVDLEKEGKRGFKSRYNSLTRKANEPSNSMFLEAQISRMTVKAAHLVSFFIKFLLFS